MTARGDDRSALLAGWLHRLVALLLAAGGPVARQLERAVEGKGALLVFDGTQLLLSASRDSAGELAVRIEPAQAAPMAQTAQTAQTAQAAGRVGMAAPSRRLTTGADALRDVIEGRSLLDAAVAQGRVDLQAPLHELLAFHELVMLTLAWAPRSPGLRALWAEFDERWPREMPDEGPRCVPLERQRPEHGVFVRAVPREVQQARSPVAAGAGLGPNA